MSRRSAMLVALGGSFCAAAGLTRANASCSCGHRVSGVVDLGSILVLEDGSSWFIDPRREPVISEGRLGQD